MLASGTGGFRPYKVNTNTNAAIPSEMKMTKEETMPEVIPWTPYAQHTSLTSSLAASANSSDTKTAKYLRCI